MNWDTYSGWLLLGLGFGFAVFWPELGHFLAAKWAGVKVEQFAVGFGHALLAYRKGLGLRVGTTAKEYKRRLYQHLGKTYTAGDTSETVTDLELSQASQ